MLKVYVVYDDDYDIESIWQTLNKAEQRVEELMEGYEDAMQTLFHIEEWNVQ